MLLSGGIDSAAALYLTKKKLSVRALTFEYNGIARSELAAARAIATRAGVIEHRIVRLPDLKETADIAGFRPRGLPPTYIPLRNSIFYAFAASYAEETGAAYIVGGHNGDDGRIFADVSPEFFGSLQRSFRSGSNILRKNGLHITRPLSRLRKPEVIKLAASIGVPLELTWSCHRDSEKHCWRCEGCLSRMRCFREAGIVDPLRAKLEKIT
ncbi:MAG TPA: 7-cyano-7-deazaguanine synthase [Nitrososphaerales archaeon]|nr:7-cyano-7-deazaguanine synthase [Nitrososphaerales archaeon]